MPVPSPAIIALLATCAPAGTAPTFGPALVLVQGTILAPGRRTVSAAWRAVGLAEERHCTTDQRVLNRAVWSPLVLSRLLLGLRVLTFIAPGRPLGLVMEETLARRRGKKIVQKGRCRDAVRSPGPHGVTSAGLHGLCVTLRVPLPWSRRLGAGPVLTVPALAPATSAKLGKRHRPLVDRAAVLVRLVRRGQPDRASVLVGASGYAAVSRGHACGRQRVPLVSRLRLDAARYAPPAPQPPSKRGPQPQTGARQPSLAARLLDPATVWQTLPVPWYGGQDAAGAVAPGTALWPRAGPPPLPVRWVLVRSPAHPWRPLALFCPDPPVSAEQVLRWYRRRGHGEVTFEDRRAHRGLATPRHWSRRAVDRPTPCLCGLCSLVVLLAHTRHPAHLPIRRAAWSPPGEAPFADAWAAVRAPLWASRHSASPSEPSEPSDSAVALWASLGEIACYAA